MSIRKVAALLLAAYIVFWCLLTAYGVHHQRCECVQATAAFPIAMFGFLTVPAILGFLAGYAPRGKCTWTAIPEYKETFWTIGCAGKDSGWHFIDFSAYGDRAPRFCEYCGKTIRREVGK
jgi:hypothetical protein